MTIPASADIPWSSVHDDLMADIYLARRDLAELQATSDFLVEALDLRPGDRAFDQCCGIGDLSRALAARGIDVLGVDRIECYIDRARRDPGPGTGRTSFHSGDACSFVPGEPCDGTFNWYTSFGQDPADGRNQAMLERAWDSLRSGGRFALDFPNMAAVLSRYRESTVRRNRTAGGEVVLLRESRLQLEEGRIDERWTLFLPGGDRAVRGSFLRLYLPHQLGEMLMRAGFDEIRWFGGLTRAPLGLDSPRCIVTGRKP